MASRFLRNLKKLNLKIEGDASIPRGTAVIELHDENIAELGKVDPDDQLRADVMDKANKVAVCSASIECAYKAAALVEATNCEDFDAATEKWKYKVGVSGSDVSWGDVENNLRETLDTLERQEKELKKHTSGGRRRGKKPSDSNSDGNASEEGSDTDSDNDSDDGSDDA